MWACESVRASPVCLYGFPRGSSGKEYACNVGDTEMHVQFLGWEYPLEEKMATQSSILAWKIPWTEDPGGRQSTGSQRVKHSWACIHVMCVCMDINHINILQKSIRETWAKKFLINFYQRESVKLYSESNTYSESLGLYDPNHQRFAEIKLQAAKLPLKVGTSCQHKGLDWDRSALFGPNKAQLYTSHTGLLNDVRGWGTHKTQLSHLGKLPRTPTSHDEATQLIDAQSLSHTQPFATSRTVGCNLSIGFSKQVYWSGLPYPSPEDLPDPGIKP